MRIIKEAEERKNEILDAAERLFGAKGYDSTSTNDILDAVGIVRGTLYYHFRSKEDILDAMIDRMMGEMTAKAKALAAQREIPVLRRLTMIITALNVSGELGQEIMEQIHRPQNALMHQKIQNRLLSDITPLLAGLIEEGNRQGICQTDYPAEVAATASLIFHAPPVIMWIVRNLIAWSPTYLLLIGWKHFRLDETRTEFIKGVFPEK